MARKRSPNKGSAPAVAPQMVRDQSWQMHGLRFGERRAEELARDLERHLGAIAQASSRLDLNDEPARFARLLHAARSGARKSR
jgi:hypothetical protein